MGRRKREVVSCGVVSCQPASQSGDALKIHFQNKYLSNGLPHKQHDKEDMNEYMAVFSKLIAIYTFLLCYVLYSMKQVWHR